MNPKALKDRKAKLFLAKAKKEKRSHHGSSSEKSAKNHRKWCHHNSQHRCRGSRSRSRSPSARPHKSWEVSPTVTPQPSPAPSVFELVEPQSPCSSPAHPDVQDPSPAPAPQEYPAFPAPGMDPATFLNATFAMFQSMAPGGGAPAGPTGPMAFNLGDPASYRPSPFMPFCPTGDTSPVPTSVERISTPVSIQMEASRSQMA
ncbi:hypothetical protein NDU88_007296 [Pleurodeles waltl]|uniref:Uncharacterized protein n=1 Tax=Pleurodeles waltl TaxID=8319 RepID=A0AAV7PM50_PLEWA|nr:hypothetical protein NDU88_007296 [Pleurodeles waltl]